MVHRPARRFVSVGVAGVLAAALSIAVGGLTSSAAADSAPACSAGTTVATASGPVCGLTANGVTSYLGIRYGAAPVGNLRWAPPQPATPWTDTFVATQKGNPCPQGAGLGAPSTNEDCLNLNVQVPANRGNGHLPVMVEIHGGGFLLGSPADGTHLATAGDVIYVAMNYRLGIFGFLAEKGLGAHSGDYGLMDQQAALRWVQRNIARFGGDPHNVTIFGQSAGGASVCDATISPTAAGLFQRGISQSGFYNALNGVNQVWEAADCKTTLPSESQAQQSGATFAAKVGCGSAADVAACLRGVDVQTLLNAGGQVLSPNSGGTIAPIVNGTTLPMSPAKAFATGHVNHVGLVIGVDRDEFNGGVPAPAANTAADYQNLVVAQYGGLAPAVFARYPLSIFPGSSPYIAYRTIVADSDSVCPSLAAFNTLDRELPVYAWINDNADSPRAGETTPLGAFHDAENAVLFPNGTLTFDPNQAAFSDQITSEWTGYAWSGTPSVAGTPRWSRYSHDNQQVMGLQAAGDSTMEPAGVIASQHNCGFWDSVTPTVQH